MDENKIAGELVKLRSDVLYLVRLVEKLEKKIVELERTVEQNKPAAADSFVGMHIEKL